MLSNQHKTKESNSKNGHRNKILEYSGSYAPTQGPQRAPPYNPAQGTQGAPPYHPLQTKNAPPYHPDQQSTGPPPFHPTIGPPGPPPYGYPHKTTHKPKSQKYNGLESPYGSETEIDTDTGNRETKKKHKVHGIHTHIHKAHKKSN